MKKYIIFLVLFAITQNIDWFILDRDMNLLVVLTICLGALLFVFEKKHDRCTWYWILMYIIMFVTSLYYKDTFRVTTIAYSGAFIFFFIFYKNLIKENWLTLRDYYDLLSIFILLLVVVQLLQQIGYIFGFKTINSLRTSYGIGSDRLCFCSLASEPAHFSRALFIYSYSYEIIVSLLKEKPSKTQITLIRASVFWGFSTMGSVTGLVSYLLLLLLIIKKSSSYIIVGIISFIFVLVISFYSNFEIINRAKNFLFGMATFNSDILLENEHSGGVRIAPILIFFNDASFYDIIFGKGIDASIDLFYGKILGVNMEEQRGGILPNLLYNYGLFTFIFFLMAIRHDCISRRKDWIVFLYIITVCPFNFQYTWLSFMLLITNKHMTEKEEMILASSKEKLTKKEMLLPIT